MRLMFIFPKADRAICPTKHVTRERAAVLRGRKEMAVLLIQHGADLSLQDGHGNTDVAIAVLWNKPQLLEIKLLNMVVL